MLNNIALVGRLTDSIDLRYTGNGTPVCNFTIACERNYKNKQGEKEVDFIKVVTWRKLAETCAQHLGKGRLVAVSGRLQISKNENNGRTYINPEILANEVQFLDWPDDSQKQSNRRQGNDNASNKNGQAYEGNENFDIPF